MKSMLLASTALALVLSTSVAFAGPTATITDAGNNNVNVIDQSTKQNSKTSATIEQLSGTDGGNLSTNAYIKQSVPDRSTARSPKRTALRTTLCSIRATGLIQPKR